MEWLEFFPNVEAFVPSFSSSPGIFDIMKVSSGSLSKFAKYPKIEDCPKKLAISAFNVLTLETEVMREGDLVSALAASMAVPLLFKPVIRGGTPYLDGFVGDVGGLEGIERDYPTLYFHATDTPLSLSLISRFSNIVTLSCKHLPIITPWDLREQGNRSFNKGRDLMESLLSSPLSSLDHRGKDNFVYESKERSRL